MLGLLKELDPSLDFSDTEKVQMLYFNLEKWLTCQTLLTDTGLEKKVRYRTELVLCDQCRHLTTARYLTAPY